MTLPRNCKNRISGKSDSVICGTSLRQMLYHKTKDILYVKQQLGHKRIENTLVYTHLFDFGDDEYVCKVAGNSEEARTLVEQGFDYVATSPEGHMLFKKLK